MELRYYLDEKTLFFFTLSIFRTLLWQPVGESFFARVNENMELEVYLSIRKLPGKADSSSQF